MYGGFAALRAAVGGSWTSPGMQQPDGNRLIREAVRPPEPVLPAPVGVPVSLPAGLLKGARPVGHSAYKIKDMNAAAAVDVAAAGEHWWA